MTIDLFSRLFLGAFLARAPMPPGLLVSLSESSSSLSNFYLAFHSGSIAYSRAEFVAQRHSMDSGLLGFQKSSYLELVMWQSMGSPTLYVDLVVP